MQNKTIAIIGIGSYILSVLTSAQDLEGTLLSPIVLIVISVILTIIFYVAATVRLWKRARYVSVILASSAVMLLVLGVIQGVILPQDGSAIIILLNATKIIHFLVCAYAVVLLWTSPGREMYKIRSVLHTAVLYAFGAYVLSAQVMFCYYWWRDVKAHDGFVRAVVWSPLVGVFKATHWPYYQFVHKTQPEKLESPSAASFKESLLWWLEARKLIDGLPSSQDHTKDMKAILTLLQRAKAEAENADRAELNAVQAGLGDAVVDMYIPSLRYYINGISAGDAADLSRGDAAVVQFQAWMKENLEHAP